MAKRKPKVYTAEEHLCRKEREKAGLVVDGTKPLRRPWREQFVHRYLRKFDAERAAKEAGYSDAVAKRIGPYLLQSPHVQARLRELVKGSARPAARSRELVDAAIERAFPDMTGLFRVSPSTGEVTLDLRKATPAQLSMLDIKQVTREVGGKRTTTTTVSMPDFARTFSAVVSMLPYLEPDERDEKPSELALWVAEISSRGSAAPINSVGQTGRRKAEHKDGDEW